VYHCCKHLEGGRRERERGGGKKGARRTEGEVGGEGEGGRRRGEVGRRDSYQKSDMKHD